MKFRSASLFCLAIGVICASGCLRQPEKGPGGLNKGDFQKICENGFDVVDQAQDHNDYPWSMEYYLPDGKAPEEGFVYVGTWNRVQQWKGFQPDKQPVFPEIRRYRPDVSPEFWQRVLDTRDLNLDDHGRPQGFRSMKSYRNKSDGKLYLYAGGRGDSTSLWRSPTGEPGTWEQFWGEDQVGSIRGMAVHNGLLYMSYYNDYAMVDKVAGEGITKKGDAPSAIILATDGASVWTVMDNGFGNKNNVGIFTVESFNGWLYAGTHNPLQGAEVWKLEGPDPAAAPVKVIEHGGPRWLNEAFMTMYVWQDHLYAGSQASFIMRMILGGLKPADLLRIDTADHWEAVAGPDSIGGEKSGFGERSNAYIWSLCAHDGWLYAGTYDIMPGLNYMFSHPRYLLGMMGLAAKSTDPQEKLFLLTSLELAAWKSNYGGDLYKTQDGKKWYCVTVDGFGNHNNYGLRTMKSAFGRLFIGLANPYDGLEVWASKAAGQEP
jgi:hypothetical protein